MEAEELCPKCKNGYLKATEDPRELICHFCGRSQLHLTLKDIEDCRGNPDLIRKHKQLTF